MALDYLSIPGKLSINYNHNCLSASSICTHLCLGSWGCHNLTSFEDVLAAVKGGSKGKWEDVDMDVEVVE